MLTFQTGGNNTVCVTITIINDNNIEPAESFSVRFTQAGSNIPVFAPATTVVILDQDQGTSFIRTFYCVVCVYVARQNSPLSMFM